MAEKKVIVNSSLDARQAAFFVQTASKYDCKIQVMIDDKKINAKSIMGTIALGIIKGKTAVITAEGSDAEQAVDELAEVLA
ncbi:HPr family phosphocarrier protein [Lachnospiraceae bacterium 46-61]